VGLSELKVTTPIKTGAQQALVIPEKIPKVNVESTSLFRLPFCLKEIWGIGNLTPSKDSPAKISIKTPPKMYVWS